MTSLFYKNPIIWSLFDTEEKEESDNFEIEEVRFCDCFINQINYLIGKNNGKLNFYEVYRTVFWKIPRSFQSFNFYIFYGKTSIFCCNFALNICSNVEEPNKNEMDKNCSAELVDYCCLYFLSRETIFNCICDSCQKTLLRLVSEKIHSIKLK